MAFLSHSIPWHILGSIFQYQRARSRPGPQYPDLFHQNQPTRGQQLEYFAQKLQSTLREHAGIERRRYRDAESYAERADGWSVTLDEEKSDGMVSIDPARAQHESPGNGDVASAKTTRSKQPKELCDSLQHDRWPPQAESRRVYSDDFVSNWNPYLHNNLREHYTSIETWTEHAEFKSGWQHMDDAQRWRCWFDERRCADVVKLLIADAACTSEKEQQRYKVETVFLLAHHPRVRFDSLLYLDLWCCNCVCGIGSLAKKTMKAFLYLNLMYAKYDEGGRVIFAFTHGDRSDIISKTTSRNTFSNVIELYPHPEYMNFNSWIDLLADVTRKHDHLAETAMFRRFLLPKESDEKSAKNVEKDPFADIPALKEFFKSMWKVLVICDMIFKDKGRTINWEYCILEALHEFWDHGPGGLMGKKWLEYEDERSGYQDDASRSLFCFY